MIRPAEIVLPILRAALPDVAVVTYFNDADHRQLPMVLVRPNGGSGRHPKKPDHLTLRTIEMSAHHNTDLASAEVLYDRALEALYTAWQRQTATDVGWIHSIDETMGATQLTPLFEDSWRILGLIKLGLRPTHPLARSS